MEKVMGEGTAGVMIELTKHVWKDENQERYR